MNNAELIDKFITWKRYNDGAKPRTAEAYQAALERLVEFLEGRDLEDASIDDVELFGGLWLHKQGVNAISRRPYVAAVREFYKWLAGAGRIKTNPAADLRYPKGGRRLPSMITLGNAEKLMWAPDFSTFAGVRDAAILSLLLGCGLRREGVANLNESNLVQTEHQGDKRYILRVMEKGEKERILPVPREADMVLRLYLEHEDLQAIDRTLESGDKVLFVSLGNKMVPPHEYIGENRRMAPKAIWEIVKKHGKAAGIPDAQLHPHALRHLYGTELLESDVDQHIRQELMGHADPRSTEVYTHLAMRKKMTEADRANPFAKIRTPVGELISKLRRSS
ncbi:integrase/recombinase XerC/integrase/recombinase XerD [Paucimonas lemoignei]|uniref:Integrase/recombinase XerC/integrase/recombinase XerD n=1 Tax=Paucimonas lemoignei TaxID=29443 RepID=A0A4R3HS66_PAULE|nr:tyrosine-type recombinase/integrase [Paucimonas lemoignei]TCS35842.1 integrase/recombinase XerC/integrase/recombinase XerD [Paucimonas lemoignei]